MGEEFEKEKTIVKEEVLGTDGEKFDQNESVPQKEEGVEQTDGMMTVGKDEISPEEEKTSRHGLVTGNNAGVGVIELILILVVLVALVLIFKEQLTGMVERAMEALEKSMERIIS